MAQEHPNANKSLQTASSQGYEVVACRARNTKADDIATFDVPECTGGLFAALTSIFINRAGQ